MSTLTYADPILRKYNGAFQPVKWKEKHYQMNSCKENEYKLISRQHLGCTAPFQNCFWNTGRQ